MAVSTMASGEIKPSIYWSNQTVNTPYTIGGLVYGITSSGTTKLTTFVSNCGTGVIKVTTKPSKLDWYKYSHLSESEISDRGNCEVNFNIVDYDFDDILSYRIDVEVIRDDYDKYFRISRDLIDEFELAVYDEVNDILNIGYLKCSIEGVHLNGKATTYLLKILNWDEL